MGVDIFSEHRISETIKKDLERTLNSSQMSAFKSGLDFKSTKTRQTDESLIDLLVGKLQLYAKGWIECNANKTSALWDKSLLLDNQISDFKKELNDINTQINSLIVSIKGNLNNEQLEILRNLERITRRLNE